MKRLLALLWLPVTVLLPCALTAQTNAIRVGVCAFEPFVSVRNNGQRIEGLFPDFLNHLAGEKGWTVRYVTGTPAEQFARLEQGGIDLLVPAPWPDDRTERQRVSRFGLVTSRGQLYVANTTRVTSLSDLSGKTIAVTRGDPYYDGFRTMLADAGVQCVFVKMDTYTQIFESLDRRRIYGGLIDRFFGEQEAAGYQVAAALVASPQVEFRFVAPLGRSGALIEAIDALQSRMKADTGSFYYRSLRRWTGERRRFSLATPGIVLALMAAAGWGAFLLYRGRRAALAQVERMASTNRDLRKAYEEQVRRKEDIESQGNWWHTLLDNTEDVILVHGLDEQDRPSRFLEMNRTACSRLEYPRAELLNLTPREIEVSSDWTGRPVYHNLLEHWRNRGTSAEEPTDGGAISPPSQLICERLYRTKYGVDIPMEVTIRVLGHEGRPVVFYSAHDITNRRETQFALQESERRFHDFFARSPIGIALYDASRKLTDVNPSALAMFGVSDRNHFVIHNLYEAPGLTAEARQTLIEGGTVRYEAVLDFDRRKVAGQAPSTRSGKCHFDILITNLRLDRDFSPKGFLVMLQDTTERRRAEEALRQNERMLRQSHKMEAIGTLAGGVAHDFNNILTPIIGHTEMAMLTCAPHDAVQDNLEEILKASHRAKDLVKQILMFSRQTEQEVRPIRLIPVINEVNTLLRGSITANVELQCVIQTNRDIVRADPTQVHQVLMNLGLNAIHAMKGKGGTLEIGLHMITVDARTKTNPARLRRGDYAELTVRDTGTGMDRATLDRIFEPFFTTKANGEGTGMGLAVVHGIISSLHGAITVDSEAGKGSTFHVFLPLLDEAEEQAVAPALTIPRGTETVLFVDDETDIVNMVGQMLKSLGYRPVTCTRGPQALDVFQKNPTQFDLLITDQVMPAMTGMQLVREIHLIRADLPVLLCTGFSRTTSDQELFDAGISEIIMKPILLRQFAEAVRRVLDTKAGRSKPAGVSASGKP